MTFWIGFGCGAAVVVVLSVLFVGLCAAAAMMRPRPSAEQASRAAMAADADRLRRAAK